VASLPLSKASNTAITASVTNGGSYSLICQNNSRWSATPTISSCPAPAIIAPPPGTTSGTTTTSGGSTSGTTTTGGTTTTTATKSRGVRLDPGYFYSAYPGQTPSQIASDVVTNLKNAKANTIYLYAYNTVYGAYYPTTYSQTSVESGLGSQNIFGAVLSAAHAQGFKVVAVVPLNNFMLPWQNNSAWRVKQAGGADYQPSGTYLLSASNAAYKSWYVGFINDLIARNPLVDQVEAVEPTLDYSWSGVPDQNPSAITAFNTQYPGSAVGSSNWLTFRAKEFTNLVALFNQTVHANGKESCLVQTWTVNSNGTLYSPATLKSSTAFDWIGIATLTGTSKMDHLISEFIWQQWFSEYGTSVFNPEWISTIGVSYTNTLRAAGSTSDLIVHVEISTFSGSSNTTTPTLDQFSRTMTATATLANGISVYDYNQIKTRSAFSLLSNWAN
ncbi:MAG: hypothetical protein ACXWPX_11490, partial [Pseudobdellovibrio sp.]